MGRRGVHGARCTMSRRCTTPPTTTTHPPPVHPCTHAGSRAQDQDSNSETRSKLGKIGGKIGAKMGHEAKAKLKGLKGASSANHGRCEKCDVYKNGRTGTGRHGPRRVKSPQSHNPLPNGAGRGGCLTC